MVDIVIVLMFYLVTFFCVNKGARMDVDDEQEKSGHHNLISRQQSLRDMRMSTSEAEDIKKSIKDALRQKLTIKKD